MHIAISLCHLSVGLSVTACVAHLKLLTVDLACHRFSGVSDDHASSSVSEQKFVILFQHIIMTHNNI